MKNKSLILLIFACIFFSFNLQSAEVEYIHKIQSFLKITGYQLDQLFAEIDSNKKLTFDSKKQLRGSIYQVKQELQNAVERLTESYKKSFILKNATKEEKKQLVFLESNLSIAAQRILESARKLNQDMTSQQGAKTAAELSNLSIELRENKSISVPISMGLGQVLQSSKNVLKTVCSLAMGVCSRQSLNRLVDLLDEKYFLRNGSYEFKNLEEMKSRLSLTPRAVFIIIGNHDQPLMDIQLARKASSLLGSQHHITMTRKSVYPVPPPEKHGDVVFVVDNDPKSNPVQKSIDLVTEQIRNHEMISLAVYPEGMLPYTGGQMPMTVKEGAFVIARKLAHSLNESNIPVYLVRMKSNIIEHLTSIESLPATVDFQSIEKVPTDPLSKTVPDLWVESQRLLAENAFNSHRGRNQMDIFNLDNVPGSKVPYGMGSNRCFSLFMN